jgi:hypothetical protein
LAVSAGEARLDKIKNLRLECPRTGCEKMSVQAVLVRPLQDRQDEHVVHPTPCQHLAEPVDLRGLMPRHGLVVIGDGKDPAPQGGQCDEVGLTGLEQQVQFE